MTAPVRGTRPSASRPGGRVALAHFDFGAFFEFVSDRQHQPGARIPAPDNGVVPAHAATAGVDGIIAGRCEA